jgi:hypothetical protein
MYTFLSQVLARTWFFDTLASVNMTVNEVQPDALPDLVVLDCDLDNVADLTGAVGLSEVGLPTTYPEGFRGSASWVVTQPIGAAIYSSGHTSILTRSCTATEWDGSIVNWAELAIFTEHAPEPVMVERVSSGDWL